MSTVRSRPATRTKRDWGDAGRGRRGHREKRASLIHRLVERDGCQCVWCGTTLPDSGEEVTVDHLIPRSVCHSMRPVNLVLSCATCNNERGDMPLGQWARRARRLELTPNLRTVERALDKTASMGLSYSPLAAEQLDAVRRIRESAVLDSLDVLA
jgi:5-methylcytosine-specific restriction endonuclease McrA